MTRGMGVRVVLCDLGGVLIDFSFDLALSEWARAAGGDLAVLKQGLVVDEAWAKFEVNLLSERDYIDYLRHLYGLRLTDAEIVAGWNSIYIGVNDEVERVLRSVATRGLRVVAVTNTNVTHQRVWRDRFADHLDLFDAIYSSCEIGLRKPDRAFFANVLEAEGVGAPQALFIDDSQENVDVATALGILAFRHHGAKRLQSDLADHGVGC